MNAVPSVEGLPKVGARADDAGSGRTLRRVTMEAPQGFEWFVQRYGDRAAETAWLAALAMIERTVQEARQGQWGRWRHYPRGELRQLRRDLAPALELARFAAAMQEEVNDDERQSLAAALHVRAAQAGRRAPTDEETRQRVRARLARLHAKREGLELELWQTPPPECFEWADQRIAELAAEREQDGRGRAGAPRPSSS